MLVTSPEEFDYIEIGLASPDKIRFWSHGEVEKPETINYRTFKPERKGLFCEKIFGPVKDWECSCGKYRRVRYRGIVCERCGVQVTHSKVRRERMGHLELAAPVSHIWFLKGIPGYMGLVMDMTTRQLEEVIYYDAYIVTAVDDSLKEELHVKKLLSTEEYYELKEKYGNKFTAGMGASAIQEILSKINLQEFIKNLRESFEESKGQKRLKITKRLKIMEAMKTSGNRPEWMVLEAIPIMPPDLRPMVQLEGGRFATSDLNDLYRRVVNRNNRLKRLIDIGAPEMIIRNEKRMLQEAVDVLIANGKRGRAVTGSNGRPLKSLGNIIEGKQGRFRQNLLGKRVDYSGRSVIVVGPHLKFNQCGLPKEMALELFKPFVIQKLVADGYVTNVKTAKRKIEKKEVYVWDVLEEIIKGHPVLLNRAPTLHRLGIQAFDPILVEGSAIQVHPLVCTAFNADFDGDQMAVHVPLSLEAQAECRLLVMSTNNILTPSNGRSIVTPSQDMVLGIYFLTVENPGEDKGKGKYFYDFNEAMRALDAKVIKLHSPIFVRINNEKIETTIGRLIFNETIWSVFDKYGIKEKPYVNTVVGKKQLADLILGWYQEYGNDITADLADNLKTIGFKYATISGISISIDDLKVPKVKASILENADKEVAALQDRVDKGSLSEDEMVSRSHDVWRNATSNISEHMEDEFGKLNNIFIMANSGARGNIDQVRQLAGMRGLMSDAQGRTVKVPIKSNFKEGLKLAEYFISCYGARKGLVDTALRTADSGYLTRRLVDVAQDVTITEEDCKTKEGADIFELREEGETIVPIGAIVEGRVTLEAVKHPKTGDQIIAKGQPITSTIATQIQKAGIESVKVRSVYTCKTERGVCRQCYGLDLATGQLINGGDAVGIIAAQSIGEPGTQLTMRTFHTGGVDLRKAALKTITAKFDGQVEIGNDLRISQTKAEGESVWVTTQPGKLNLIDEEGNRTIKEFVEGSQIHVKDKQKIKKGDIIAKFDPGNKYLVARQAGTVKFLGLETKSVKGESGSEIITTNQAELFVYDAKNTQDFSVPEDSASTLKEGGRIESLSEIAQKAGLERSGVVTKIKKSDKLNTKKMPIYTVTVTFGDAYIVHSGANVFVKEGDKVSENDILALEHISSGESSKTKDIVQGLPRVEELFEARKYRDNAILSEIEGVVDISQKDNSQKMISIIGEDDRKDYKLQPDVRILVYTGQKINVGDILTDGMVNPHDLLLTKGVTAAQKYLVDEVLKVYTSQGVSINSKHVEVIVRQMTRKVNITEMGDSNYLPSELIDIRRFELENSRLKKEKKQLASGERVLLGITRASLNTESFISASSFQETAKVLSKAAIYGEKDEMYGLKENVIIGKLIPAGTGAKVYENLALESTSGETLELTEEEKIFKQEAEAQIAPAT